MAVLPLWQPRFFRKRAVRKQYYMNRQDSLSVHTGMLEHFNVPKVLLHRDPLNVAPRNELC